MSRAETTMRRAASLRRFTLVPVLALVPVLGACSVRVSVPASAGAPAATAKSAAPAAVRVERGPSLETVVIYTSDMVTLAEFYGRGVGLGPFESPAPGYLGCDVGPIYFGVQEVDTLEGCSAKVTTLWFTVDDLDATFARIVDMGATVRFPPQDRPGGARLACVYDPDRNLVGLSQRAVSGEARAVSGER